MSEPDPYVSAPISFVISAFESNTTLDLSAGLYTEESDTFDASATAVLYVTKAQLRSIFKFQTDALDVTNSNVDDANSDIKFYTYYDAFQTVQPLLNPANAVLESDAICTQNAKTGNLYPDNKMMVAHDYIRHLAKEMFTTPYATDLFSNELEVLNNVRKVCGLNVDATVEGETYPLEKISNAIKAVSVEGDNAELLTDGNNVLFMPNTSYAAEDEEKPKNLGRLLLSRMMKDVKRMTDWLDPTSTLGAENEIHSATSDGIDTVQSMPFIEGDEIVFKVTVNPAPEQHKLVRDLGEVPARSYRIIWRVSETDENVAVVDPEVIV